MSLLADLLAKIKQPQSTREVPPNLQNIVYGASGRSGNRKKIMLLVFVFVASITAGLFLVSYVKPLLDSGGTLSTALRKHPAPPVRQESAVADGETAGTLAPAGDRDGPDQNMQPDTVKASAVPGETKGIPEDIPVTSEPTHKISKESSPPAKENIVKTVTPDKVRSRSKPKQIDTAKRDAYLYNARKHEMNNNYAAALSSYKMALNLDRNNIAIINNIAYIFLQLDLPEDAAASARDALQLNRDHLPSLVNLAIAQARSGNYADAHSSLDRAIRLEPGNSSVILNLAILNERQGNDSAALHYYTRLHNLGAYEGLLGKARIYEKTGRNEDALLLYRQIIASRSPSDAVKKEIGQRIRILLAKTGKTDTRQEQTRSPGY